MELIVTRTEALIMFLFLIWASYPLFTGTKKSELQKLTAFLDFCLRKRGEKGLEKGLQDLFADSDTVKKSPVFTSKVFALIEKQIQVYSEYGKISKACHQELMAVLKTEKEKFV